MSISLPDSPLDARVDALAAASPFKPSRAQLVRGILEQACEAFERTGDADAWRFPARGSTDAQSDSSEAGSIRPAKSIPSSRPAMASSEPVSAGASTSTRNRPGKAA